MQRGLLALPDESIKLDGKDYHYRILTAGEYGNIIDSGDTPMLTERRLVSASTGIPLEELNKLDHPTYGAVSRQFNLLHRPKQVKVEDLKTSPNSP